MPTSSKPNASIQEPGCSLSAVLLECVSHLETAAEDDHGVWALHRAGLSRVGHLQPHGTLALANVVLRQLDLHSGDWTDKVVGA
jgi:hypothetical protein